MEFWVVPCSVRVRVVNLGIEVEVERIHTHALLEQLVIVCHCCSFALANRLAVGQTMVPEPNLVVPDHLPLSGSVVEMATHAFKEACLGEFMAAVQVCGWLQIASVHV